MYRRGDVDELLPTYLEQSEVDIFSLSKPGPTEAEALDAIRTTGQERNNSATDVMRKLVRIHTPAHKPLAMQTQVGMRQGVMTIDTPRSKGAIGFLAQAGVIRIGQVSISSKNQYAAVMITALDDRPIEQSTKVLVTTMTDDRPFGFAHKDGKITSLGQFPFTVENIDVNVNLGWANEAKSRQIFLDENGMPRQDTDEKSAVYRLWSR
jgi:hypothetical protein